MEQKQTPVQIKPKKGPTQRQISTWENDGGTPPSVEEKNAVLINGSLCISFSDKVKAYARTPWDFLKNRLSKKTHH